MFEIVFNLPFKKEFTLTSSTLSSSHKVTKYQMKLIKKRNDLVSVWQLCAVINITN